MILKSVKRNKKPDAQRSLETLSQISRQVHSHTVSAGDIKKIVEIENALKKTGMLLGVDLPEDDIWNIVGSEEIEKFCILK